MRFFVTALLIGVATVATGQTTSTTAPSIPHSNQKISNAAIQSAVLKMEAIYRKDLPANATDAQMKRLEESKKTDGKIILNDLASHSPGKIEFIIDDVIEHLKPGPATQVAGNNPLGSLMNSINDRETNRQTQEFLAGRFEIHGHLEWKSAAAYTREQRSQLNSTNTSARRGGTNASNAAQASRRKAAIEKLASDAVPVHRLIILSNDNEVANWGMGDHKSMTVSVDNAESFVSNVAQQVQSTGLSDGVDESIKLSSDYSAAYISLVIKAHEIK